MFVAACRRAACTGHDIVLATSSDTTDNLLSDMATAYGIACMRGPLDDVLSRFVMATDDMQEHGLCVRLTCDNVLPDGHLIDSLIHDYHNGGYAYYAAGGKVPYGFSCEIFSVASLRQAQRHASTIAEKEHVTPWIRTHMKNGCAQLTENGADYSAWRCTIDTLQDYLKMASFFAEEPARINKNAFELMHDFVTVTTP